MADRANEFGTLVLQAIKGSNRIIDMGTLANGLLGVRDARGAPVMSELEMRNAMEFLLLNQLAAVVRARLLPSEVAVRPKEDPRDTVTRVKTAAPAPRRRARAHEATTVKRGKPK